MGPQEDYIETVVTCEGDFHDPQLEERLQRFQQRLERLLIQDGQNQLILKKVEPWNSVRVTFNIPREAALRLKQLAEQGNSTLRQLGVLGVQIEGDRLVSLTVQTHNNQRAELVFNTSDGPAGQAAAAGAIPQHMVHTVGAAISFEAGLPSSSDEVGSPGPNMEVTRKNIEEYLRQFNSILPSAVGAGPSGAGPSSDIFKAPGHEGVFRPNNIAGDGIPGPSGHGSFQPRLGVNVHGPGAFPTPGGSAPSHRGPRGPSQHNLRHQNQPQFGPQATALPQTAAVGLMDLPPPPPYPLGSHRTGVANNVGRQGKKATATSPLLINLLQTDPMAAANSMMGNGEKPKKKRRKRKDKQAAATSTSEDQAAAGLPIPMDTSPVPSSIPQSMAPSAEMNAMPHRRVSPIPLPASRMGQSMPPEVRAGNEGFMDRPAPTASAALASLAQNQRVVDPDAIINPYTGQLEPRDSASDLSPVKKDQLKARSDSLSSEAARKDLKMSGLPAAVSGSATKSDSMTSPGELLSGGLSREEERKSYTSTTVTSMPMGVPSSHLPATSTSLPQRPGQPLPRSTSSPSTSVPTSTPHYAPHHFGPSQLLPHSSHPTLQHSARQGMPTMNGPVHLSSPHTVTSGLDVGMRVSGLASEGASVSTYSATSRQPGTSVRPDPVHGVSIGDTRVGAHPQIQTVTTASVTSQVSSVTDIQQGSGTGPVQTPVSVTVPSTASDSHNKLLNSASPSPAPPARVQQLIAEYTSSTTTAASPTGSKPSSDGDDNSNHSGTSPVNPADGAMAPSALLDANGTKVDNHDSGVGSSSERSEDTTPSEAGDGEFQAHVTTTENSDGSKTTVNVTKSVVNCRKEGPNPHITVGYVQVNQQAAELYHKDAKSHLAETSSLIGDKALREESLRQMTHMMKSSTGASPLATRKELELSTSLPSKTGPPVSQQQPPQGPPPQVPPHQRLMMKHKSSTQAPGVYQNGPISATSGANTPLPAVLRLPTSSQPSAVHHPAGITISHAKGVRLPSLQTPASGGASSQQNAGVQISHRPPGTATQGSVVRPRTVHQQGVGPQGQQLHPLPTSVHSSCGSDPLRLTVTTAGSGVTVSQSASHVSVSVQGPSHNNPHTLTGSVHNSSSGAALSANSVTPRTAGMAVSSSVGQPVSVQHLSGQGNGIPPSQQGMQHMTVPQSHSQHISRTPSPNPLPQHGSSVHGPSTTGHMQPMSSAPHFNAVGHSFTQASEHSTSRSIPSPVMSAKASVDLAAVHALAAAHGMPPLSKASHSQPVNNIHGVALAAASSPSSIEAAYKGLLASTEQEGGVPSSMTRQGSPRLASAVPLSMPSSLSKSPIAHELDSMASSLEFLEANFNHHVDDGMFSPDDDLALLSDSGFFTGHAATNGSGGVSTEGRVGSNITSMYTKRSSPINVNMLNHMYAAGLPQPRRLTESVIRLVKPLPNPENALPHGARVCKSPGSSGSRHSSNGSASPGRASQGGARSPGVSLTSSPAPCPERLAPSPSAYSVNSAMVGNAYPPVYHNAQPAQGEGTVNCISASVIPVAPHPQASLQTPISRQKGSNGTGMTGGQFRHAANQSNASTVVTSSLQPTSACVPSPSSQPASVTMSDGAMPVISSHPPVLPHSDVSMCNHSTGVSAPVVSLSSVPSTTSCHSSSPLPDLVSLSQDGDVSVRREISAASRMTSQMGTSGASHSSVTSQPHNLHPLVSVCNTSSAVDSTCVTTSVSSSFSALRSYGHQHSVPGAVSRPSVTVPHTVPLQTDLSARANTDADSVSSEDRTAGLCNPVAASVSVSDRASNSQQKQKLGEAPAAVGETLQANMASAAFADSLSRTDLRTVHSGHSLTHVAVSSQSETKSHSAVITQHVTDVAGSSKRSPLTDSDSSKPLEEDLGVPELENSLETGPPGLKEKEGGKASGLAPLSMPPLSAQDMAHSSSNQGESLHSKPPLLHPSPPLIPTVVPSATPPPPPLTPVLLNDPVRKDSQGHNTPPPSVEGHYPSMVFGVREVTRTASPLAAEPSATDNGDRCEARDSGGGEKTSVVGTVEASLSETSGSKLAASEPKLSEQSGEDSLKPRRAMRKRKPTLSESDSSSSEPAPKLICLESASGSGNKSSDGSKTGSVSDQPPKLQREGKRSTERKEEERVAKIEEDKPSKKEDGRGSKTKDEGSRAKEDREEEKSVRKDEEKSVKKDEEKSVKREEEKDASKSAEKNARHSHKDSRVLEATPEEVAQKMAATGGKRRFYTYVPEYKVNDSFFDVKLLPARTRNQGKSKDKDKDEKGPPGPSAAPAGSGHVAHSTAQPAGGSREKEETAEGIKRSTRLRTKDVGEGSQSKRKRTKEHR